MPLVSESGWRMQVVKKVRFNGVIEGVNPLQVVTRLFQVRPSLSENELKQLTELVKAIGAEELTEVRIITTEIPFAKQK